MSNTDTKFDRPQDLLDAVSDKRDGMSIGRLDGRIAASIAWRSPIRPSEKLSGVRAGDREHTNVAGPFGCRADGYETDRRSG